MKCNWETRVMRSTEPGNACGVAHQRNNARFGCSLMWVRIRKTLTGALALDFDAIHCFEPASENRPALKNRPGHVLLYKFGLSNRDGEVSLV